MIGFVHPETNLGMFLQIMASLNTVPPRILRIVPFGDFHIFFKLNSGFENKKLNLLRKTCIQTTVIPVITHRRKQKFKLRP